MAAAVARALVSSPIAASRSPLILFLSKRFLASSPFAAGLLGLRPSPPGLSRVAVRLGAARINSVRCMARRAGDSAYSPLNSGSGGGFSDRPPTEMAPLFPGCDYEHWLIVMDKPGGEGATKQQMIDCYIQTLAKVVGRY